MKEVIAANGQINRKMIRRNANPASSTVKFTSGGETSCSSHVAGSWDNALTPTSNRVGNGRSGCNIAPCRFWYQSCSPLSVIFDVCRSAGMKRYILL